METKYDVAINVTKVVTYIGCVVPFLVSFMTENATTISAMVAIFSFLINWYYQHLRLDVIKKKLSIYDV